MRNFNIALLGYLLIAGCDAPATPNPELPPLSNPVLRGMPDFTPLPGDVPTAGEFVQDGPSFRIRITSEGQIYRGNLLTSKSDVVAELLTIQDVSEFTVVIEGEADVRVGTVTDLQSYLSDSVPGLGATMYVVASEPLGG